MYDYSNREFEGWGKTPRLDKLSEECTITEKIDGTNGCIVVEGGEVVAIKSRNRFIKPGDDNMGFAFWVHENREELADFLGNGEHYGEWAGPGIQQNPHNLMVKTFFLFNTRRPWATYPPTELPIQQVRILYQGQYDPEAVIVVMQDLQLFAARHAYEPEGVIVQMHQTGERFKSTFKHPHGKWRDQ